jgi:vacuolar-type H+-ATPase subunit F/Vma7
MSIVAVGGKAFVTGFMLTGVRGEFVSSPSEALEKIEKLAGDPQVALIMVSDDVTEPISAQLDAMRVDRTTTIIYEVPKSGSKKKQLDHRAMVKSILGV